MRTVQNAGSAAREPRCVKAKFRATPACFDADQLYGCVTQESVENSDRVAAAADAGKDGIRQAFLTLQDLAPRLLADYAMKITNHHRIRMRSERRTKQIVCVLNVGHPIAHGFADCVLQSTAAVRDTYDFRSQHAHAENVQPLPAHVLFAHVNDAIQAE